MNLSPRWLRMLRMLGWKQSTGSELGAGNAPDFEIMAYATANECVVLTHDLTLPGYLLLRAAESRVWCRFAGSS
jgi:predicted nuclease of predicted toxin-antitoxin system